MLNAYIIDANQMPQPTCDMLEWAVWYETADRNVDQTKVGAKVKVSTVFVGLDHAHNTGPPLLWETMVFGGPDDGFCRRYSSLDDARMGHAATCGILMEGPQDDT